MFVQPLAQVEGNYAGKNRDTEVDDILFQVFPPPFCVQILLSPRIVIGVHSEIIIPCWQGLWYNADKAKVDEDTFQVVAQLALRDLRHK